VLKNAIEAAGVDGWARLLLADQSWADDVEVVVEDSGCGPTPEQRPHLFDPFYSGRSAGRGRGLGLPVAWRLARQQGGDLRLESTRPGEPTRFVMRLPRPEQLGECQAA
jgi:signal transduction histidine kinase